MSSLNLTPEPIPSPISRRSVLKSTLAAAGGTALLTESGGTTTNAAIDSAPDSRRSSPKRYGMKTSINLWAFPYPDRMSLKECLMLARSAGFDAVELNYDLENDLSPKASPSDLRTIRKLADEVGIEISGLCSFLYWPYSLTDNDPSVRSRGLELAGMMIRAAGELGTSNLLTIAGSTYIPWLPERSPVPIDVCDQRSRKAIDNLLPQAEKAGVRLNVENIFFNGYLTTPGDLAAFVDRFSSRNLGVHFDTGNVMLFQFPEHWIPLLGGRINNVHFKEFSKKGTDHSLESFTLPLYGTTNWPAVMDALEAVGYNGYVTWELFHPATHYPEGPIYYIADALRRILGRT